MFSTNAAHGGPLLQIENIYLPHVKHRKEKRTVARFFQIAVLHNSADTNSREKNSLKPQITYERLDNERAARA